MLGSLAKICNLEFISIKTNLNSYTYTNTTLICLPSHIDSNPKQQEENAKAHEEWRNQWDEQLLVYISCVFCGRYLVAGTDWVKNANSQFSFCPALCNNLGKQTFHQAIDYVKDTQRTRLWRTFQLQAAPQWGEEIQPGSPDSCIWSWPPAPEQRNRTNRSVHTHTQKFVQRDFMIIFVFNYHHKPVWFG